MGCCHPANLCTSLASCLQMDVLEMLPDVDADISTFPVGDGLVIEVAERPTSPASRVLDQASTQAAWLGCPACPAALQRGGTAGLFQVLGRKAAGVAPQQAAKHSRARFADLDLMLPSCRLALPSLAAQQPQAPPPPRSMRWSRRRWRQLGWPPTIVASPPHPLV